MSFKSITLLVIMIAASAQGRSIAEWRSRSIYFLLTDRFARTSNDTYNCNNLSGYCGGTWKGIQNRLDYIQGMGFNAIWITPIVENTANGYHGYWAKNFYALNGYYGSESDLFNLITECKRRDIWIMLDVVANHVGYPNSNGDYSSFPQFNNAAHYHSQCTISDYDNQQQVENCWLGGLPDLSQENSYVQSELLNIIKYIITRYNIDGLRIDTVKHVPKFFWTNFQNAADSAAVSIGQSGMFTMGEIYSGVTSYVADYQNYINSALSFPFYYTIQDVFVSKKSMTNIANRFTETQNGFKDPSVLGNFLDNHDVVRFRCNQKDEAQLRNALAWVLMARGIPIVYYGTEQYFGGCTDPQNREVLWNNLNTGSYLYTFIAAMNKLRLSNSGSFATGGQQQLYSSDNAYVFARLAVSNTTVFNANCSFSESARVECGYYGIGQSECESKSCCWSPASSGNYPWCFVQGTGGGGGGGGGDALVVVIVALTNAGTGSDVTINASNPGIQGKVLVNIHDTADQITVGSGSIQITLKSGNPKVYLVQ